MIVSGHVSAFVLLVVMCVTIYVCIVRAAKKLPKIRKMAALDAIEEIVGRATETGRPIMFTQGSGTTDSLSTPEGGPQIVAGLSILGYLSRLVAKYGAKLICGVGQADALIPTREIVRASYVAEGHPENFHENMFRYLSPSVGAYASAVTDIMRTEQVAGTVIVGPMWAECMMILFHGADIGAVQVGGTAYVDQMPNFAVVADYMLIGEEVYAAGAYLSNEPSLLGSIFGEDLVKVLAITLVIATVVASVIGAKAFLNIIRL
jgi:hypothetical protein